MLLYTRMRSLPPSAMNRRFLPSDNAKRGKLRVASQLAGYVGLPLRSVPAEVVQSTGVSLSLAPAVAGAVPENELFAIALCKSGWPTATSAGAALAVGMLFQTSTRL